MTIPPLEQFRDKLLRAPGHPFAYAVWHADLIRRSMGKSLESLQALQDTVRNFYGTLRPSERRVLRDRFGIDAREGEDS